MSEPPIAQVRGMLPKTEQRPPRLAFAVNLYRTDLLFRSLADIVGVGLLILLFMVDFSSARKVVVDATGALVRSITGSPTGSNNPQPGTFAEIGARPGSDILDIFGDVRIDESVIRQSGADVAPILRNSQSALDQNNPSEALNQLLLIDPENPSVAYARAVATLQRPVARAAIEAMRDLRKATQAGIGPAFTLNGLILLRLVVMDEQGRLPSSERASLDGAGNIIAQTNQQMVAEAVLWWQRAAALQQTEAFRYLGLAEARGYAGKPNISAAIAHWRDASARDDALSRIELAKLYLRGGGVVADPNEALRLLRMASDQGLSRADLVIAIALVPKSIDGDHQAAKEGMQRLTSVMKSNLPLEQRILAHRTMGLYLTQVAPADLRDPPKGLDHWRFALRSGDKDAPLYLSKAFESGLGTDRDLVKALGYLRRARENGSARIDEEIARLSKDMSPEQKTAAEAFKLSQDPMAVENLVEFSVYTAPSTVTPLTGVVPGHFRSVKSILK